ncbi:glucose-6-phosphate isomerase [Campylobacter sp. RM9333]|uniref:glucose-6-phosphate isomerase n=1 Tax=Campylobacter sp. RM9333 TaxID=2735731 RepID=UPI001DE77ADE|nr:glucose-6-phosphate isomerase [Campylobacter sp. RM9333]
MITYQEYFEKTSQENISLYLKRMNEERQSGEVGFYDLPLEFDLGISKLQKVKEKFANKSHFIVIGMGGSSVGTRAITSFLGIKNIDYLDNISSTLFNEILEKIDLKKTLFILVSKSGNTIECISYFRILLDVLGLNVDDLKHHLIGICMQNTKFYEFLKTNEITHFDIEENVSGRFSVLSNVGLVPLFLAGANVDELIKGAKDCMNEQKTKEHILNLAYTLSTKMINKNYVLFTYCEELRHFNEWFVQLVAESLGKFKEYKRVGLTPISLIGPKDQHSFLQLIIEGPKDKFVEFIRIKPNPNSPKIKHIKGLENLENQSVGHSLDELLYAQSKSCLDAIKAEGIETSLIELDGKSAYNIGYLIYYYELLVGACGLMIGISTYDQPGVESAKKLLKILLTTK